MTLQFAYPSYLDYHDLVPPEPSGPKPHVDNRTPIPAEAYASVGEINAFWPRQMDKSIISEMPGSYASWTPAQKEHIDKVIFYSSKQFNYFQTSLFHISSIGPGTNLKTYFNVSDGGKWRRNDRVPAHREVADRAMYGRPGDAGGGGPGVPDTLPVDYLASPWRMPEVNIERFRLGPLLNAGFLPGRRPGNVGGIISNPSRIATIRVMSITGECVYATTNFMLEGVQRLIEEDYTPASGFEENLLQLHGEKFKLFNFRLRMLHTANFDWRRSWDQAWQHIFRGSQLALRKRRFYILEGTEEYGGYPLRYSDQKNAAEEPSSIMNMTMFVTDNEPLPEMTRFVSKDGQTYFKWLGTKGTFNYSSSSINLLRRPAEYHDDEDLSTEDGYETEIISEDVDME